MRKDIITMSKRELKRLPILHKVMEKRLTQVKAAKILDLGERQIRRLIRKIEADGDQAIIHQNRGKISPFKIPESKIKAIINIVKKKYYDFGPTFASEKLQEEEKIKIGREKLRLSMIEHHLWRPEKNNTQVHQWRERKHHSGEMIQMDGSDHDWLEDRGPRLVIMGYIDDATNHIFARFYEYEGTFSAMDSFRRYTSSYGLPASLYLDRHSTYKTTRQPNQDEDLKGEFAKTQFARALNELEVKVIFAHSPQAKGRIERTFATLQDRLVKELRLANVSTLEQANLFLERYLPKHNARFAISPLRKTNLHRPLPKHLNLDEIFCLKEYRLISNGYTCHWKNRTFLIKNPSITMKKQRICIMEHFDGRISLKFKNKRLPFAEITAKDILAIARGQKAARKLIRYAIPPKSHPWRKFIYSKRDYKILQSVEV